MCNLFLECNVFGLPFLTLEHLSPILCIPTVELLQFLLPKYDLSFDLLVFSRGDIILKHFYNFLLVVDDLYDLKV